MIDVALCSVLYADVECMVRVRYGNGEVEGNGRMIVCNSVELCGKEEKRYVRKKGFLRRVERGI